MLDTTGSMGGLIDGAKRRIWSIARRIGEGRPRPDLRIALVAYRDIGDAYVTRDLRLHRRHGRGLRAISPPSSAEGGGDGPEHVSAALHDAVHRLTWSSGRSLRMIVLVGDAPPHVDYQDGFDYRRHVGEARQRGIVVESIQCGQDAQTAQVWREIASTGAGHYAQIDAQGGMPVRVTAVDAELARLNAEHGGDGGGGRQRGRAARHGDEAGRAQGHGRTRWRRRRRATTAPRDRIADHDLVDLPVAEQKKALPPPRPPVLKGKTEAEALGVPAAAEGAPRGAAARIRELPSSASSSSPRGAPPDAFDEKVVGALKEQAKKQGIAYDRVPARARLLDVAQRAQPFQRFLVRGRSPPAPRGEPRRL